jgi:hypothetical protein
MKNLDALDREVNRTIVLGSGSRMTRSGLSRRLSLALSCPSTSTGAHTRNR